MKNHRLFSIFISFLLLSNVFFPVFVSAQQERKLEDESIYDLLVDRYNNGNIQNDLEADPLNMASFNGGDFAGIESRLDHIVQLGFTMISIGAIFETETYDGQRPVSYEKLDRHFGTAEDFQALLEAAHKKELLIMADFPLDRVSNQHEWVQSEKVKYSESTNGLVEWDVNDPNTLQQMQEAVVRFVETYNVDAIRLTHIDRYDTPFLNDVIQVVKSTKENVYVMTDGVSEAHFDLQSNPEMMAAFREAFVAFDRDSSSLNKIEIGTSTDLLQIDEIDGPRFTYDLVEARMFPPTRWKLAATALLTLPGVPMMTYGTEIAMNGQAAPENHQFMNFKTDMELFDYIKNVNTLRNQSEALRTGDLELLHNENGFLVYKRSNEDETWLVVINNTQTIQNIDIPAEVIGEDKLLRGLLDGDLVRKSKNGLFQVVLEREIAEVYYADKDKGFNTPYLIASILVYVLFLGFIYIVWRKGKQQRAEEK